jgi:CheY-like chemotaxis protein
MGMSKILIVDDDFGMSEMLGAVLADSGEIVKAGNGLEALGEIRRGVDLVITDLSMPQMDGMELLERIRSKPDWKTRVIMMSGNGGDWIQRAKEIGVNAVIHKPFGILEVREKTRNLLRMQ